MKIIKHKFVEFIPDVIEEGILYVSVDYCTAIHKCICGCGNEVVTPLSPTDWEITFDGKTISLNPSIGNWSFQCRSHYWIRKSKIDFAEIWSEKKIDAGRVNDFERKTEFYKEFDSSQAKQTNEMDNTDKPTFWEKLSRFFGL